MRVLILGGDGYLGWPTAMRFSGQGHDVAVVDSFARRRWVEEAGSHSLTPIVSLEERIQAWREVSGKEIEAYVGDISEGTSSPTWSGLRARGDRALRRAAERTLVDEECRPRGGHAGEQRDRLAEAPLGDAGPRSRRAPDQARDDGRVRDAQHRHRGRLHRDRPQGPKDTLPFPKLPGSLYHLSKVHDSHNIHFACRIWGLRATDLNQGVVYGIETPETKLDERLITRFDYDELFGTALNRFAVQAVIGHPLTVYGKGGQTRGFLNIVDTLQCVSLTAENPPAEGEYRVFNQFTEVFNVADLAEKVRHAAGELGIDVQVDHVTNPRLELEQHYYNPTHTKLLELGLQPTLLSETLIESMLEVTRRYKDRVIADVIDPVTQWRPEPLGQPSK